jgi:hypothetical protein
VRLSEQLAAVLAELRQATKANRPTGIMPDDQLTNHVCLHVSVLFLLLASASLKNYPDRTSVCACLSS